VNIELFGEISKITVFGKNHGKRQKLWKLRPPWFSIVPNDMSSSYRSSFVRR